MYMNSRLRELYLKVSQSDGLLTYSMALPNRLR